MEYFLTQVINGLAIGSIYALLSVGYSVIYSILNLINFAHGDLCMVGVFLCMAILTSTGNVFLTLVGACLIGAFLGLAVEELAYKPVRTASRAAPFVSAVGVATIMRGIAQVVWGSSMQPFPQIMPFGVYQVGNITISGLAVNICLIAAGIMILVTLFLEKTRVGLSIKCVSSNINTSYLMGIRVNRIISLVYAFGAAIGVLGMIFYATYYQSVFIAMGFAATVKAFTAALMGGLGNLYAAFFGGILLGLIEALGAGFISSGYRDAIAYAVLIVVLVLKPNGIFGAKKAEKV